MPDLSFIMAFSGLCLAVNVLRLIVGRYSPQHLIYTYNELMCVYVSSASTEITLEIFHVIYDDKNTERKPAQICEVVPNPQSAVGPLRNYVLKLCHCERRPYAQE